MQTGNGQDNKVVSITNRSTKSAAAETSNEAREDFSWEEVQRRNEENRVRLQREREKANKGVIRSYRLKH